VAELTAAEGEGVIEVHWANPTAARQLTVARSQRCTWQDGGHGVGETPCVTEADRWCDQIATIRHAAPPSSRARACHSRSRRPHLRTSLFRSLPRTRKSSHPPSPVVRCLHCPAPPFLATSARARSTRWQPRLARRRQPRSGITCGSCVGSRRSSGRYRGARRGTLHRSGTRQRPDV
jgi:hypothetical protein